MNRRNFLRNVAAVGVGSAVLPTARSSAKDESQPIKTGLLPAASSSIRKVSQTMKMDFHPLPFSAPKAIKTLENQWLKAVVNEDASVSILDKTNHFEWQMGPVALQEDGEIELGTVWLRREREYCDQYPGRFKVERSGDKLRYTVIDNIGVAKGSFLCDVSLTDEWLYFTITDIEETLPSLVFPTPVQSDDLIIPLHIGKIFSKPIEKRFVWQMQGDLTMRWFGGQKAGHAWIAIEEDGWADSMLLATQLAVSPVWLKSLGQWTGTKTIKYRFIKGNYVDLAKIYRSWSRKNIEFRTLAEKMQVLPALKNLKGGKFVSFYQALPRKIRHDYQDRLSAIPENIQELENKPEILLTHQQLKEKIRLCKKHGMRKGLFLTHGWINNGYDGSHPDIWPPEPLLGSIDELKELCKEEDPFFFGEHDNYQDMYPVAKSFPNGINLNGCGELMRGGCWAGGQCFILNSRNSLEYVKRNWEFTKHMGFKAMYIDTITSVPLYQSFEEGNTQTRLQDFEGKQQILKFFYEKGIVLSSEQVGEIGLPFTGWQTTDFVPEQGVTIPLWQLVYHDCHFISRACRPPAVLKDLKTAQAHVLHDMLYGSLIHLYVKRDVSVGQLEIFSKLSYVDEWHDQVGTEVMLSHRFMTEDRSVEETVFANGNRIICNFGDKPTVFDGKKIEAKGYALFKSLGA